jgi:hypothetical protein
MGSNDTSKVFATVREILELPKDSDSWDLMQEGYTEFISDDDVTYSWEIFSEGHAFPALVIEQKNLTASWELLGKIENLELLGDRDDCFREIVCLSKLLKPKFELKYCMDTWHSSERYYILLSTEQWVELNQLYGYEQVSYRFMSISESAEQFIEEAFTEENQRKY